MKDNKHYLILEEHIHQRDHQINFLKTETHLECRKEGGETWTETCEKKALSTYCVWHGVIILYISSKLALK